MKPLLQLLFTAILLSSCVSNEIAVKDHRPNIVLIVADDLGYSDLGCFGSEIATPNIDALSDQGNIFTSFYTSATCSPTRAMLLTGTDNHIAGLGNMAENIPRHEKQIGQPGYEGYLNDRVVSVATVLKDSGYRTYAAGKWHLGFEPAQSPYAHGFDKSFMLLNAYSGHYYPNPKYDYFWEDKQYGQYPEGKYSTEIYTDKLLNYLEKDKKKTSPFFVYAAYTSPHWPLQAPMEYINKYQGNYDIGYDSLHQQRIEALKSLGIVPNYVNPPPRPKVRGELYGITEDSMPRWNELDNEEKRIEARKMEIYAGMVENLDYHIGRLVQHLKDIGEYENTMIVFMSDNGAAVLDVNDVPAGVNIYDYMGTFNSFTAYGPAWAYASSAVNYLYKGYVSEGGIKCPMIIKMPYQIKGKGYHPTFASVKDLAPSFYDLAGVDYPQKYKGKALSPLEGESILPYLSGEAPSVHDPDYVMGWELFGRYAVRKGNWKITRIETPFGNGGFQLFNLEEDPGESKDLSDEYPEKFQELINHWNQYVSEKGVILSQ